MEIALIYPHQLFMPHPALAEGRVVWLVEDPLFFGNDPNWPLAMHRQKLVLHRASMAAYAEELEDAGYDVRRVETPEGDPEDSAHLLERMLPKAVKRIHVAEVCDDVLGRRLRRFSKRRGVELVIHDSPNFLSPDDFSKKHLAGGSKPFMARFYQAQRVRMGILLEEDGSPAGGRWSFDDENRKKLPKKHVVPDEPRAAGNDHLTEAILWVKRRFPENPGSLEDFRWPVTRKDAEAWLEIFLRERFAEFGAYEDAISVGHAFLHHGVLTPMLNIGLLDPGHVVERALSYAARSGKVPLNSLEGFVRQVIGWREFMRGMYVHRGVAMRNGNFWNFRRRMPASFYDGTTGIAPVDRVIRQVLEEGWCHHIERLMVLGNFFLLCRIHPDDVYRWFMELFVDAYDWVMVPNVYGMSQFADGGSFTTKPYLSGSNYIRKMSDEPAGDWCAIWDALFWTFIAAELEFFSGNPRLSMMARTWEKLGGTKQEEHRRVARGFLRSLGKVSGGE
jgi:deoxyribodipyrimidine photolyase-related protein